MRFEQLIWYVFALLVLFSTVMALRARQPVHAILWLVSSLFGMALLFFLLAAPLVAVFEVVLYAGAIMVLFLFVIMMLDLGHPERYRLPKAREWLPPVLVALAAMLVLLLLLTGGGIEKAGQPASLSLRQLGQLMFREHGLAVELISLQLLFALVGVLYLGRQR
jgi:NADH-quinone oxidoreductase subunit J